MVGTKRSSRIAARKSKPKYNDSTGSSSEEDEVGSSNPPSRKSESAEDEHDDDGESDFSGGEDSDGEDDSSDSDIPLNQLTSQGGRAVVNRRSAAAGGTRDRRTRSSQRAEAAKMNETATPDNKSSTRKRARSRSCVSDGVKEEEHKKSKLDNDGGQVDDDTSNIDDKSKGSQSSNNGSGGDSSNDTSNSVKKDKGGAFEEDDPTAEPFGDETATREINPRAKSTNNLGNTADMETKDVGNSTTEGGVDKTDIRDSQPDSPSSKKSADEGRGDGGEESTDVGKAQRNVSDSRKVTDSADRSKEDSPENLTVAADDNDSPAPPSRIDEAPSSTSVPQGRVNPTGCSEEKEGKTCDTATYESVKPKPVGKRIMSENGSGCKEDVGNDGTSDGMQVDNSQGTGEASLAAEASDEKFPPAIPKSNETLASPPLSLKGSNTLASGSDDTEKTEEAEDCGENSERVMNMLSNDDGHELEPEQTQFPCKKECDRDYVQMKECGSEAMELGTSEKDAAETPQCMEDSQVGVDTDGISRIVSEHTCPMHPPINTSYDIGSSSSPDVQKFGDSNNLGQRDKLFDSSISMTIQYPQSNCSRKQPPPSVGKLKMALYLEASRVHLAPERIFANYWEAFEKYITLGSYGSIRRTRSDSGASFAGVEAMLGGFLTTRKMKRLHNKLVLAIMAESMRTSTPDSCSPHVPQQWQIADVKVEPDQMKEKSLTQVINHDQSERQQWNADFGRHSGAWTVCGDELAITKTDDRRSIQPEIMGSFRKGGPEKEEILPSVRLPGVLEVEPFVRDHTGNLGLTASQNAVWMLVVAVRQHASSVIKKVIANDNEFESGHAPSVQTHLQTSLKCRSLVPKCVTTSHKGKLLGRRIQDRVNNGEKGSGGRVITPASLAHVLEETPSRATRLSFIGTCHDRPGTYPQPGLDNLNCVINASIQRGARNRQRFCAAEEVEVSSASRSPTRHSVQTTTFLPLNKPHFGGQARDASVPNVTQQHQAPLPSTAAQNMPPRQMAQLMSHSDHMDKSKASKQHARPVARADISNLEPLTKPGFPNLTNDSQQKPEQSQRPAQDPPAAKSPPPKAAKRGAKDLAAMMARSRQAKLANNEQKKTNGAAQGGTVVSAQDGTATAKMNTQSGDSKGGDKPAATIPNQSPSRGRGFGVKNLSRRPPQPQNENN